MSLAICVRKYSLQLHCFGALGEIITSLKKKCGQNTSQTSLIYVYIIIYIYTYTINLLLFTME